MNLLQGRQWNNQLRTSDNDAAFSWDAGRDEPFVSDSSCLKLFWFLFVGTTDLKAWKIERIYLAFVRLGIGHTCMIQSWVHHHWSMLIIDGYWWLLMSSSQCASCSCKTGSYRDCTYLVNAKSWEHWHTQFVLRLPMPYLDGSVMVGG